MKKLLLFTFLLLSLAVGAQPAPASAALPADEAGFLADLVQRLQQALPDHQFRISGHSLWGQRHDGEVLGQLDPQSTYQFCRSSPRRCTEALEQYVSTVAELARTRRQPLNAAQVRLTLRPQAFVDEVRQQNAARSGTQIYARPVVAGLVMVPVLDFLNSLRFIGAGELNKLKLSEDQLFELGRRNLQTGLLPLQVMAKRPGNGDFGRIEAEDHAASRVLLHADWAHLAAQYQQHLVVAIPTPNVLLYGDGANPAQIASMRRATQELYQRASRPLSLQLLRWTATGWDVLPEEAATTSPQ